MPQTVEAKLLLGWMTQYDALEALNSCIFDPPLTRRAAIGKWKEYRDKVAALEPRTPAEPTALPLTDSEQRAIEEHLRRINATSKAQYLPSVLKIHPGELIAKQFHILTERSEQYATQMGDEGGRINTCLGIGLEYNGQLTFRKVSHTRVDVDLPHPEFVVNVAEILTPNGLQPQITFQERDRHILIIRASEGRLVLWGGYHRTHAVLCHMAGEAAAVAPLLTTMTGIPEVVDFLARPSTLRDTVLAARPPLLRDFLDSDLFMVVNLRKRRARARIEQPRPGKLRWRIELVNDDS